MAFYNTHLAVLNILGHAFVLSLFQILHCLLALALTEKSKADVIIPLFSYVCEYNSLSLMFSNCIGIYVGVSQFLSVFPPMAYYVVSSLISNTSCRGRVHFANYLPFCELIMLLYIPLAQYTLVKFPHPYPHSDIAATHSSRFSLGMPL